MTEEFSGPDTVRFTGDLLEREGELAHLGALLAQARAGGGRALLIEGPAGIGKTRLLEEARAAARTAGVGVLGARGGELEADFGFGVVRQLLEPALARASAKQREELLAGAAGLAAPVFAAAAQAGAPADAEHAVLHGLYWLVANLAERSPLLLAIDDVHWADAPSLRFLLHLSPRLEGLPVALVLARRSGEQSPQPQLLQALVLEAQPPVLRPRALSPQAVQRIVRQRLGESAHAQLCGACHQATEGNPFLLAELLLELRSAHRDPVSIDPAAVARLGSERIAAAILMRVGRVHPSAPALARAVAVLGEAATVQRAAALAGVEPHAAAGLVESLVKAAVLAPGEPLCLVHPVVRSAIYADLSAAERASMHARSAELLATESAEPEAIAVHLLSVEPAAEEGTVELLGAAARAARSRGVPESAVRYLRRALEEPPAQGRRLELEHALGSAALQSGEASGLERLGRVLRATPSARLRAKVALTLHGPLVTYGRIEEALEALEFAIAALPSSERELKLRLEAAAASAALQAAAASDTLQNPSMVGRAAERLRLVDASELRGETVGERMLLASLSLQRTLEGRSASEAVSLARRAMSDYAPEAPVFVYCVASLIWAEEFDLAERLADAALAGARARGSLPGVVTHGGGRSMLALRRGQVARAESEARSALEAARIGGYELGGAAYVTGGLIDALIERGELDAALDVLELGGLGAEIPDNIMLNWALFSRARLRLARGEVEAGVSDLRAQQRRQRHFLARNPSAMPYRSTLAVALAGLGEVAEARRLASEELALARAWGTPRALGIALRAAGIAAGGERGLELLREAVAELERSGGRLEHARALVDLGAMLRRGGERALAREALAQGMDLAHRCGASALTTRAREELRLAGARPRRLALSGRDALTAGELRVVDLARGGMTNKQIAQALFITQRTVEMHLTNAYQKLEISSRDQLAGALSKE